MCQRIKPGEEETEPFFLPLRLPSFPPSPIRVFVRVWDLARRWDVLLLRRHILFQRLPHDVVDSLGARKLRLQPRNLILKFRRASIRSGRGKRIVLVLRSRSRSRVNEEFPVAEELLARVRGNGIMCRALS
jgi:hypothetical protein